MRSTRRARAAISRRSHGFTSHKLKGGVFRPEYELECYRAARRMRCPGDSLPLRSERCRGRRSRRSGSASRSRTCNNDYLEDPVFGLHGMRRTREKVRMPLATNTVVVGFEQLAANVLDTAVDVILLDTTFWGGIRPCVKAAGVCETFQLGVAVHSSGELGIQLATMLHLGAVITKSLLLRRRALSPPDRRHDRRRKDEVLRRNDRRCRPRRDSA